MMRCLLLDITKDTFKMKVSLPVEFFVFML